MPATQAASTSTQASGCRAAEPGAGERAGGKRTGRHLGEPTGTINHSGGARLAKTAASELDATVGTSLFKAGLELGTAGTLVKF